jgi:hypothetical protein
MKNTLNIFKLFKVYCSKYLETAYLSEFLRNYRFIPKQFLPLKFKVNNHFTTLILRFTPL